MANNNIAQKIWSFCDTLRDDGISYGDYLEQLTYLLFLKMADEYSNAKYSRDYNIPEACDWKTLLKTEPEKLIFTYSIILKTLSKSGGMLSKIFDGSQNKIHDHQKLKKLIELINEQNWVTESYDVKGEIYESLLQKNAENSGAGQYFTPRPVIQTIVQCIRPKVGKTISDPACGTGGFFLGALEFLKTENKNLTLDEEEFLRFNTFKGWEIVPSTARLCLMNLFLHGIGDLQTTPDIEIKDSLKTSPLKKADIVLANPPFGKTSSDIVTNDTKKAEQDGYNLREDLWVTTSNKQLAFLQHIVTMLKSNGRAAVVLPDNVLFEGGAGETVRKKLLETTDFHTILRLPTGIFYAQGVKANVIFFDLKQTIANKDVKEIWIYDFRTNIHHTLKKNPLRFSDLKDFITCYNPKNIRKRKETFNKNTNPEGRWRRFSYDEILGRDKTSLDIIWLKDTSFADLDNLPDPDILANEIVENLEAGLNSFKTIISALNKV